MFTGRGQRKIIHINSRDQDSGQSSHHLPPRVRARLSIPTIGQEGVSSHRLIKLAYRNLCKACDRSFAEVLEHFNRESLTEDEAADDNKCLETEHHQNVEELEASANNGCALCQLFCIDWRDALSRYPGLSTFRGFKLCFFQENGSRWDGLDREVVTDLMFRADCEANDDGLFVWYEMLGSPGEMVGPFYSRGLDQTRDLGFARNCLHTCLQTHSGCQATELWEFPTRLIDIGEFETSEPKLVRGEDLVLPVEEAQWPYVALSHSWGNRKPESRTRLCNIGRYEKQLPVSLLEQTFQDAVTVTRELGCQYLWTDTHCIIQDSVDDWEKECARMDSVYSNALITIAAADSPDAYAGFLSVRPKPHNPICEIDLPSIGIIRLRQWPDKKQLPTWAQPKPILQERGWVVQERLLSKRTIHFSTHQMAFECKNLPIVALRYDVPPHPDKPRFLGNHLEVSSTWLGKGTNPNQPFDDDFYDIVSMYTACHLSRRIDLLPALSGVAKRYHSLTGDRYLAGIWNSSLVHGMCWHRAEATGHVAPSKPTLVDENIPSWSWASSNTLVVWDPDYYRTVAEIMSADAPPAGNNPFGQVDGGQVVLRSNSKICLINKYLGFEEGLSCEVGSESCMWYFPDRSTPPGRPGEYVEVVRIMLMEERLEGKRAAKWLGLVLFPIDEEDQEMIRIWKRIGIVKGVGAESLRWVRDGMVVEVRIV